jgi:hypothetical protein
VSVKVDDIGYGRCPQEIYSLHARAPFIFDVKLLAKALRKVLGDDARKRVGWAPGAKGTIMRTGRAEERTATKAMRSAAG